MSLKVHYNRQATFLKFIITFMHYHHCCLGRLGHQLLLTSPLTSFPLRFSSSNRFCLRVIPFSTYTALMLNTTSNLLSNKDGRIRRHSELAFGHSAWARYSRDSNVITVFVHIPTLRIRAGCQCPPCTRSWPSSRELMDTGYTSLLSLRDNVLFCILCYTPFPMTSDRAGLSKYVHSDIGYPRCEQCHFGPVAQHSLVLGTKFEHPLIHWTSN